MDLLALRAVLSLDKSAYEQGLDEAESDVSRHGNIMSGLLGNVGSIAGSLFKVVAGGVTAGATATAALAKQSVGAYSAYEQLSGGIAKLFGAAGQSLEEYAAMQGKTVDEVEDKYSSLMDAQTLVMDNAKQAYRTVGVSANEYMETVSGFSAALVNSLGGDTVKAAESADVAMRAMSDNVNTFGSDMKSVQFAFQGFAKQNYTMLDNLKLGYGGTKTEMERLIKDANEYAASIGEASNLSIDRFADIVSAIDLIQRKQNIAGTTAREAASTVEGSLNSLKGAWTNLIAGFANPDADVGELINNVVDTATTAFGNLMPVVERAVHGVGSFVSNIVPVVVDEVPKIVSSLAPDLLKAGVSLVRGVWDGVVNGLTGVDLEGDILPIVKDLWNEIMSAVGDVNLTGEILPAIKDLALKIVYGFSDAFPEILPRVLDSFVEVMSSLRDNVSDMGEVAAAMIEDLGYGLVEGAGTIVEYAGPILENLLGFFTDSLPMILDSAIWVVSEFGSGLVAGIPTLVSSVLPIALKLSETIRSNAGLLVDAGIDLILNLAQGIMDSLPTLIEQIPGIVINIAGVINDNAPKLFAAGIQLIQMIIEGIIDAVPTLIENIPQIFDAVLAVWSALNWVNLGKNVVTFIKNGIRSLMSEIPSALKSIGNNAISWFKNLSWNSAGVDAITYIVNALLGMFSDIPNTLMSIGNSALSAFKDINWWDLGKSVIDGIVSGISSNVSSIINAAKNAAKSAFEAAKNFLEIKSPSRKARREIGQMWGAGVALGIEDSEDDVDRAINKLDARMFKKFNKPFDFISYDSGENNTYEGKKVINVTNNITVDGAENPEDYASRLVEELELQLRTV